MRRVACIALLLTACLPEEATDPEPSRPAPPDTSVDASVVDAALPDMAVIDAGPMVPCIYPADCPAGDCVDGFCSGGEPPRCLYLDPCGDDGSCPDGQACVDGTCQQQCPPDETCGGFVGGLWCYQDCEIDRSCTIRTRPCQGNIECPAGSVCIEGRCINACTHDGECPADGYCFEGECRPFPGGIEGSPPVGLGGAGQLHAGVGVVPLDYPVGVSMAGFGGRPGPRGPYAVALGGSDRYFERQDVRALVLTDAEEVLILLRLPLCWSTDFLLTRTAQKVEQVTGINYMENIVTFGTHSHSQPGRFWNLVPATGFGIFGYGQFSNEMVERYSDSFAAAILEALGDLKPAQVGWHVVDEFDPQRRIHSNRRGEFPNFTDDRMSVIRVDTAEGDPMAAIVNFAIHGTHMELPWVTGDVAGGIEVVATQNLSAEVGHHVPVFFANGNAANISPRGDDGTRVNWGKMQVVGHRTWPIFKAAWDAAAARLSADPVLEVVQKRIPISYDILGYDRSVPQFQARDGSPMEYGGFQCVADSRNPGEEPHMDGALNCIINLAQFLGNPTVQLHKTVLSAFRIGDFVVATLPGEPSSQLGLELSGFLEADAAAAGLEGVRVVNYGYSMDHHLYLVLEEDWFRGGYEAAQGLWGWRLGRYILENSRDLTGQLFTDTVEDNTTPIKPTVWPDIPDDTVAPTVGAIEPGTIVVDLPDAARRGDMVEFRWVGGHPGVDQPRVSLHREGEGGFEPAVHGGLGVDDRGFETLTFYLGDFEGDHVWAVRWEFPWDLALGNYRVHVEGQGQTAGGPAGYIVDSAAFDLGPATLIAREVAVADGTLTAKINYPDGPSNDDGATPFEALEIRGHLLRMDPERAWPDPVKNWSFLLGPAVTAAASIDGEAMPAVVAEDTITRTLVSSRAEGGDEQTIQLDGWVTTRVEVPAPDGPGVVRISDPHGNFVDLPVE